MDVRLVMFKPDGKRKDFKVHRDRTVLGRGEDCSLRIPLLNVSRQHCELILGAGELRVRDLASSNGTYVNNRRVNETPLKAGDRLVVGPVIFTVQIDGTPAEIKPVKTRARKAGEVAQAPSGAAASVGEETEEPVIELEPDEGGLLSEAGTEESDPIAALEALAEESEEEEDQDKRDS
jgi:pSer/pThr/pTyr-binding forkhead associated (FHA) protein